MKFIIFYLTGYLLCAIFTKLFDYFILEKKVNSWDDVYLRYVINLTSWIGAILFAVFLAVAMIIFSVQYFVLKVNPKIDLEKPPKWL